jgi:hypothetical protein
MSVVPVNGSCSTQIPKCAYPGLEPAADGSAAACAALNFLPQIPRNVPLRKNEEGYLLVVASGFRTEALR